ncbi:MAG: hypothetical protein ABL308_12650 [Oceanicaulis sp.]
MKTLDLKKGIQGEYIGSASLIEQVVNSDGFDPSLHLDFREVGEAAYVEQADGPQYQRNFALLDTVCARASGATNPEWDFLNGALCGALTEMGPNSVRWNRIAGLLKETSAATNSLRNPRGEGLTVGSLAASGELPTHWAADAQGATITVEAVEAYANGWARVRLRFSGTPTGDPIIWFEAANQITASNGQAWTASVGAARVAGDMSNVTAVNLRIQENTSAGVSVATGDRALSDLDGNHRRFFLTRTLAGGGTVARVRSGLVVDWDGSGAIDLTLDVFVPQLELGSAPSSPVLPPVGAPAAATRAAETVTSLTTVSRASRKSNAGEWDFTSGGAVRAYREFRPNAPAITGRGLLTEEGTTNHIRNPHGQGASGSTAPTHWAVGASGGLAWTFARGYENGWPYVDVTASGTASGGARIDFEAAAQIVASNGQAWTASTGARLVSGAISGAAELTIRENDSGGSNVASASSAALAIDGSHRRFAFTRTLAGGGTVARAQASLTFPSLSGATSFTLRIYAPQLEQKAYPTSPILPPEGALAAATRAADLLSLAGGAWVNNSGPGTLFVDALTAAPGEGCYAQLEAGSSANRIYLGESSASQRAFILAGGGVSATMTGAALSPGAASRIAAGWATNDFALSIRGQAQTLDTSGAIPTGNYALTIGARPGGSNSMNGYISRIRYASRRISNAELETLVGN